MPAFALGSVLLAVPALTIPAALGIRGRAHFAIAGLVVAAGSIVLSFHVLSPFRALTATGILLSQAVLAVAALLAWRLRGSPPLPHGWLPSGTNLLHAARSHRAVTVLVCAAGLALSVQLVVAIAVAPNNWDAMAYHLSRAAYWLQNHSSAPFEGGSTRQLNAPPNAEMLQAWTMALAGHDRFVQLVQWAALIGLAMAIFGGSRMLGFARRDSVFAAAIFVIMPQPIMQAASAQNDLVASFLIAAALLFGARGVMERTLGDLAIAAASTGLAVGTKRVSLLALVPLAMLLVPAIRSARPGRRTLLRAGGTLVGAVAVLGTLNYSLDLRGTERILEPTVSQVADPEALPANFARVMWSFVDLPGMDVPVLEPLIERSAKTVASGLEIPRRSSTSGDVLAARGFRLEVDKRVNEDTSAFGATGFMLFLPLVLLVGFRGGSPAAHRAIALASLTYLLLAALAIPYHPWAGRLLLPGVVIGAPLLALLAGRRWLRLTAVVMALAALVPALLFNERKPLVPREGESSVFSLDRISQQTLARPSLRPVFEGVRSSLPRDTPIGFSGDEESWDYPLFDEHPRRRVVRMRSLEIPRRMAEEDLTAVLLSDSAPPRLAVNCAELAPGHYLVLTEPTVGLSQLLDNGLARPCPTD